MSPHGGKYSCGRGRHVLSLGRTKFMQWKNIEKKGEMIENLDVAHPTMLRNRGWRARGPQPPS